MNLALDVSYAVKTLIYPEMKLTGYTSYEESVPTWEEAVKRVVAAASDTAGGGTAKVLTSPPSSTRPAGRRPTTAPPWSRR